MAFTPKAIMPKVWTVVIVNQEFGNGDISQKAMNFITKFVNTDTKFLGNITFPKRYDTIMFHDDSKFENLVDEEFKYYKNHDCSFVLLIASDKLKFQHFEGPAIKYSE